MGDGFRVWSLGFGLSGSRWLPEDCAEGLQEVLWEEGVGYYVLAHDCCQRLGVRVATEFLLQWCEVFQRGWGVGFGLLVHVFGGDEGRV